MNRRTKGAVVVLGVFGCALLLSCGGELQVQFAEEQQLSFERFRDEVQPVLQTSPPLACTDNGCHATGVGGLKLVADPDDAQIIENFQAATSFIDQGVAEQSILLTDPLNGSDGAHFPKSFPDTNDCCYLIILNWIKDEPNPGCQCGQ